MAVRVAGSEGLLAGSYAPPYAQVIPLNDLEGVVTASSAELITQCTLANDTVRLASEVLVPPADEHDNPKTRLAMARVLVSMTNHVRKRFGCSESAVPLPTTLPPIPDLVPPPSEDELDEPQCPVELPPGFELDVDQRRWVVHTPQPSKMVSVCETRIVDDNGRSDPLVMLVTYKNTLAEAYQNSPEHAMPRYDITCHGTPISYRVYVYDYPGDRKEDAEYPQVLEDMASAAAQAHGCSLSQG